MEIMFSKQAEKFLKKQTKQTQAKIIEMIEMVWHFIQETSKRMNNIELVNINDPDLTPAEVQAIEAYKNGDEEYQPSISLSSLKANLGL